jgi:pilus assembly protein FimV
MSVVKRISLLCALLCAAGAAHAVNLGAIELESALNQPLRATVPVRGVDSEALSGLRVRLAPAERFEAAGLIRNDYLRNLRLSVEEDKNGRPVVRIRGEGPLREPMLDLLVELQQGRQKVQRGYTLLIDPPELVREAATAAAESAGTEAGPEPATGAESPAAAAELRQAPAPAGAPASPSTPPVVDESAAAGVSTEPAGPSPRFFEERGPASERKLDPELLAEIEAGRDRPQPRAAPSAAQPPPARSAEGGVYEVRAGETLWRVAYNTRGDDRDISMAQQMLAIVIANPEAFDEGDATELLRGSRLRIPPPEAVRSIDAARAEAAMAALTTGERRTGAVDPGLMRADAESGVEPQDRAQAAATTDDAAASEPEVAEADADREGETAAAVQQASPAEADAGAAALLAERALAEAQRRAGQAETPVAADGEPAPAQAQGGGGEPMAATEGGPETGAGERVSAPDAEPAAPAEEASPPAASDPEGGGTADDTGAETGPDARLLGMLAAVVLLLLALLIRRRRRAASEAGGDEEDAGDAAPGAIEVDGEPAAGAASQAKQAGEAAGVADAEPAEPAEPAVAAPQGDDPLADADFRIAYGMFDDAEARLQEAIRREPERADLRLKLAEVHHAAEQREAFLEAADAASGCGLDEAQRRELARMADRIAPDSRHASAAAAGAAAGAALAADDEAGAGGEALPSEPAPAVGEPGMAAGPSGEGLDPGRDAIEAQDRGGASDEAERAGAESLDFDLEQLDELQSDSLEEAAAPALDDGDAEHLLDFDLDALEGDRSRDAEAAEEEPAVRAGEDNSLDFDLDALEFDTETDDAVGAAGAAASSPDDESLALPEGDAAGAAPASEVEGFALDLDDFSLADFDASGDADGGDTGPEAAPLAEPAPESPDDDFAIGGLELEPEGEPAGDDASAMAGQLEMARAYIDLGESELARPMLQDVAERGDAEQQRQAAELLDKLG